MKRIFFYGLLLFTCLSVLVSSCKKGEIVDDQVELSKVSISNFPTANKLYYNGKLLLPHISGFRIPKGESVLTIENSEGEVIGSINIDITLDDTTLAYLEVEGNVSLLNNTIDTEPVKEGFLKIQIADYSGISDQPINLLVTAFDNNGEFVNIRDTIFNISKEFKGEFDEVDLNGYNPHDIYQYCFYLLDQNNNPILKDGYPIFFSMANVIDYNGGTSTPSQIYLSYFTLKDEFFVGSLDGFGPVGNGASAYLGSGISLFNK